ncbi:hypothetical protein ACFPK9_00715 [Rubritalea spongiae]|uniref:Uncharacterized protein n=1 Tax=Rubritalea spongiae TaxID=430797 RepID=A0ABW5E2P4_9BACT
MKQNSDPQNTNQVKTLHELRMIRHILYAILCAIVFTISNNLGLALLGLYLLRLAIKNIAESNKHLIEKEEEEDQLET